MRRSQSYLSAGKPGDWIIFPADVPSRSRSHFPESRTGRLADKVNRLWLDLAWWGEFSSTARGVTSRKKTHQVKDERELLQQNIAAEVDLSSVCRKRGRRVDADVFFKMSSEFVKGSIRATSSMNTLKSELGGEKGSRLQFAALLLSLHVTSVWFLQREAVSEWQRPFGFYVWTSFKSRVQISGGRMRRAASPLFLF